MTRSDDSSFFENDEYYQTAFSAMTLNGQTSQNIEFDDCQFIDCDFSEATFRNCTFIDCTFIRCNLAVSRLNLCTFSDVHFEACKMIGIDWGSIRWSSIIAQAPISFTQCKLDDASFMGLTLHQIQFETCELQRVDFREAELPQAKFNHCNLDGALFNRTNIEQADFSDAFNYHINVHENKITHAKFSRLEALNLLESLNIELVD